jgi:hypothetical protein
MLRNMYPPVRILFKILGIYIIVLAFVSGYASMVTFSWHEHMVPNYNSAVYINTCY